MQRMLWLVLAGLLSLGSPALAQSQNKSEDDLHQSGQTGTFMLGVRSDAGTALCGNGDYCPPMFNSAGALYTTGGGTITSPVGAGTAAAAVRTTSASDDPAVASLQILDNLTQSVSASFTPAAASHVVLDVNGAAANFALLGPSGTVVTIMSATLEIDGATAEATAWRLACYNVTPPSAYADDAAWDLGSGDRASWLGEIELGTAADKGSTQWVETHGINKPMKLSGTGIFCYLLNLTTLAPAAVAHTVTLTAVPF